MSTRSSTAASKSSQNSSNELSAENSHRRSLRVSAAENQGSFKENSISQSRRPKMTAKKGRNKEVFCSCRGRDDGTPMICCGQCSEWYHFVCIGLSEQDAEDIDVFVCSSCQAQTGLRTVRDWEGPDAFDPVDTSTKRTARRALSKELELDLAPVHVGEFESGSDSSDEYIADDVPTAKPPGKRRIRRVSRSSNDSDQGSDDQDHSTRKRAKPSRPSRRIYTSTSPAPSTLKRKQSNASQHQSSKKQKAGTDDDPTRKYCLGKLHEIFCEIFLKYPYFHDLELGAELDLQAHFTKNAADLSDEEKTALENRAKEYATQVEQSVFETYSEPDKSGRPAAAGKYKERFRMLDFNLRKPDRIILHKRIVSSKIAPEALSHMSSTDLASEEEKQSIKLAEQESLAHSILNKVTAPRAKITHKGLQAIEDVNGELSGQQELELELEQEEDERRERERMARLRAIQQQQAAVASSSTPLTSPVTPNASTWGPPPPVPLLAIHQDDHQAVAASSNSAVQQQQVEGELNLADLINIDDDISQEGIQTTESLPSTASENPPAVTVTSGKPLTESPMSLLSPTSPRLTGISPFAVNTSTPDTSTRPSFDLSSVWSAPKAAEDHPAPMPPTQPIPEEPKDPMGDVAFFGEEADDKDFDMFLEKDDQDGTTGPYAEGSSKQPSLNDLAKVWNGTLHMPLDSTIPQDVPVAARQIGGRTMESESPIWKVLFPSGNLRIDGRVAVDSSSRYLVQMRMNSAKELVAVAFSPPNESQSLAFKFLMDHLLGKHRHGLIFPWGSHPKDYHPGRELYVIPLLSSDPLPDYMELLDSLRLPKTRSENYLIGIWILNKDKLAPLLAPPAQNPITTSIQFGLPNHSMTALHHSPPPVAHPPPISSIPLGPLPPLPPAPPVAVNSVALAAEVASLTPDQIQRMLQSLSAAGTSIPAILQQQIQQQQQHHHHRHHQPPPPPTPPVPPQPWSNGAPPPFIAPFAPHTAASQSPPNNPYPRTTYPPYDHHHDQSERDGGPDRGRRGGRGNRPERGGRGRSGRNGGGRDRVDRPRDSGWPKRGGRGSSNQSWGGERNWT